MDGPDRWRDRDASAAGRFDRGGGVAVDGDAGVELRLELLVPPHADALRVLRACVGGLATGLGLPAGTVADLRLALTEVCTVAVRSGSDRPIAVRAERAPDGAVHLRVRADASHHGIAPDGSGLPLALVAALTETVEIRHVGEDEVEISMTFSSGRSATAV